jgi:hypothetical protein
MAPRRRQRNAEDRAGGEGTAVGAESRNQAYARENRADQGLVALGKSRDEIAGLLGVTVGTLQVTCSKLGISLRRRPLSPKFNAQLNLASHEAPYRAGSISSPTKANSVRFTFEQVDELPQETQQNEAAAPLPHEIERQQVDGGANLALTIHFRARGLERAVPLPISSEVISALALEAQLRGMSLDQLVCEIIEGAMANGVSRVLDGSR